MKQAAIVLLVITLGIGFIYLVIAVLPFLIAVACIVLIWWMIGMSLSGGFGIRK